MKLEITGFGAVLLAGAMALDLLVNAGKLVLWIIGRIHG
jgi:hypothetical protein